MENSFEFIKDRLFYMPIRGTPKQHPNLHFFSIDNELVYWNFFLDFGPLNLGQLYRFCSILRSKLEDPRLSNKKIVYYSSTHSHKRTNAAFLISAFAMLYLGRTPKEAYRPFKNISPPFPPFHDASPCICTYALSILDCLQGLYKARDYKFFDFETFDVEEYEHFEKVECGDLNWLVKDKFLAFAGPHESRYESPEGYQTLVPEDYIPYFKKTGVTMVIRLNKKYYDERRFIRAGIKHVDLYYLDGSCPPESILQKFISICENEPGAIAVHCKAGLGRTGTCIDMYLMKHYGFTAAEIIGWTRICRPGSVIGPQQHYLRDNEARIFRAGDEFRKKKAMELTNDFDSLNMNSKSKNSSKNKNGTNSYTIEYDDSSSESDDFVEDEVKVSQGDNLRSRKSPKNMQKINNSVSNGGILRTHMFRK